MPPVRPSAQILLTGYLSATHAPFTIGEASIIRLLAYVPSAGAAAAAVLLRRQQAPTSPARHDADESGSQYIALQGAAEPVDQL
jgi:hypothetical protein